MHYLNVVPICNRDLPFIWILWHYEDVKVIQLLRDIEPPQQTDRHNSRFPYLAPLLADDF
jgi:hypothetical protein